MEINNAKKLITKDKIKRDLINIGIKKGMTLIVHSSLSSIGYVPCGAVTVVKALMEVITEEGTIVMPAQSTDYSDPKYWTNPPIPDEWIEIVKKTMLPFEKDITPTYHMGAIAETFRTYPGVMRSNHPHVSFCAWGKNAEYITENHNSDYPFGENTPLSKLYDLDGYVLLMGVPYEVNTSFHLADNRVKKLKQIKIEAPLLINGKVVWKEYNDIETNEELFNELGEKLERELDVKTGYIGQSYSKLLKERESIDFAVEYLNSNL